MSDAASLTRSRATAHSMAFLSSSTSSQVSIFSSESRVDSQGFLRSPFRAGGPVLCSLPGKSVPISARYLQETNISSHFVEIHDKTVEVLEKYNIRHKTFDITGRISLVRSESEPIPTVFVVIPHQSPPDSTEWRQAARIIRGKLNLQFSGISIELIDEKMMIRPECSPVPNSHSIIPKWKQICDSILDTCDISEWSGVSLWRYGVELDPSDNRITVLVSVLESATGPFITAARTIQDILGTANENDIDVLFLKNERWN
ncbi:hypothetical protein N7456_009686 [Penicillium angulare]|uniref:Uncharacterized protein n=1 Tax=Penicillium angulare TaxID=116970 RepID=A0A9W9K5T3_9EURO|nr:hypothetical protein N7456_009686 [Penicillium angulare]